MPRNLSEFTRCAPPGAAYAMSQAPNWVVQLLWAFAMGALVGVQGLISAIFLGLSSTMFACVVTGPSLIGFVIGAWSFFKDWYYNKRLMCVQKDVCAAGTLVGEPYDSLDGDRKIDLLVAPLAVIDSEQSLIETVDEMRSSLPNVPQITDLQNRQVLFGFLNGLSESQAEQVYFKLIDEKLFSDPARRFQRHYYRRDEAVMGTAAFRASPDDLANARHPNPLFRYPFDSAERLTASDPRVLVPWLHCEVEGNRLAIILDNILTAIVSAITVAVAACVVCEILTAGAAQWLCGIIALGLAIILSFLFKWLFDQVNNPDDGVAGEVNLDVADQGFDTPPTQMLSGDVVLMFGNWVMDEEHDKWFEIHPVKAYYLLCQGTTDPSKWVLTEEVQAGECVFDPRNLTSDDLQRMCKIVSAVENTDPDDKFTTDVSHLLAMHPPA